MTRESGAVRIFFYNWPIYAGTWVFAALAFAGVLIARPPHALLAATLVAIPIVWSVASLLVSFYVYDRSRLVSGTWLRPLLSSQVDAWATVHAGLDAEVDANAVMPGRCVATLDIFDAGIMTAPSIRRARTRTALTHPATSCSPTALALTDASCDALLVAFTAHEIRDTQARERFFDELRRALRPGGRAIVVEHPRDFMNFLAFGPGFLHFLPRSEWLRLASHANFVIASETRVTPWIMALTLERRA